MFSYIPKKPVEYGLVIRSLCDAKNAYFYNGYVYTGKGSDGVGLSTQDQKLLVPAQCVLKLTQPIEGSNRNVTADNWFSSIQLIDELAKRKLTHLGTLKKKINEKYQTNFSHIKNAESSKLYLVLQAKNYLLICTQEE